MHHKAIKTIILATIVASLSVLLLLQNSELVGAEPSVKKGTRLVVFPANSTLEVSCGTAMKGQSRQKATVRIPKQNASFEMACKGGDVIVGDSRTIKNTTDEDLIIEMEFFTNPDGDWIPSASSVHLWQDNTIQKIDAQDTGKGVSFYIMFKR